MPHMTAGTNPTSRRFEGAGGRPGDADHGSARHHLDRPQGGVHSSERAGRHRSPSKSRSHSRSWLAPLLVGSAAAIGAAVLYNRKQARDAERQYPPVGRFLDVDGVRLHYIERGRGEPLLLIHGNGTMIQDFTVSGLVDRLADRYRVIVIDRPGYGYSTRPRQLWTPRAHARLFKKALEQLGVGEAVVYGHSWGTLVAVAMALEDPRLVRSLVLASGYYYPTLRADTFLLSPPAIPVIGDAMRYTVSPLVARAMLPGLIKRVFQPAPVPERFDRLFPKPLMLRPLQLRAAAEDAALMTPSVMELEQHYGELTMPVTIITGADDQIADVGRQSERLHRELPGSAFVSLPGLGHMIHHLAPDAVADAIDRAAHRSDDLGRSGTRDDRAAFRREHAL
jgi:pimeloyl-ACP methyl ester carboxylesterase